MARTRKRSNRQPGCLLTRDERWQLRLDREDLEQRLARCTDPARREALERQLGSITREQALDRASRPRGKKGKRR